MLRLFLELGRFGDFFEEFFDFLMFALFVRFEVAVFQELGACQRNVL